MRPPADTTPEAWKVFLEIQRRITPGEKIRRVFERSRMIRRVSEADLRRKHPQADDREIFLRRVRLELGADLFRRVYSDVLPREGPTGEHS
jgi:hypothetical protein